MTHVILVHGEFDPAAAEFVAAISAFCRPGDNVTRVDHNVTAPKGGPDATYLAAFSEFQERDFVQLIQGVAWENPGCVAVFLRRPNENRFEPLELGMAFDIGRKRKKAAERGWGFKLPHQQERFLAETYPNLLAVCREKIEDSLRNKLRVGAEYSTTGSVTTDAPWTFEVTATHREKRYRVAGYNNQVWEETEHRLIHVDMAVRGVPAELCCDDTVVGRSTFGEMRAVLETLRVGDRLLVEGVVEVLEDGTCVVKKVGRVERAKEDGVWGAAR